MHFIADQTIEYGLRHADAQKAT